MSITTALQKHSGFGRIVRVSWQAGVLKAEEHGLALGIQAGGNNKLQQPTSLHTLAKRYNAVYGDFYLAINLIFTEFE